MPSLLSSLFGRSKPSTNGHIANDDPFERRVFELGRDFLAEARSHKTGLLSRRFWNDKLMDWSMKDEAFKVQLFRFVDAFPNFTTPDEIYDHLIDFMSQPGVKPPPGMQLGLKAGGAMKGTVAKTMAAQITGMAEKFIAGTDAADAKDKLRRMWDNGMAFSVDLLGEACISDAEADAYQQKYLDLVQNLPKWVNDWPPANPADAADAADAVGRASARRGPDVVLKHDLRDVDHLGPIPRTNVSIKVSSLAARTDPIAWERCIDESMKRIVPILEAARDSRVFINFDMEAYATKDLTIEIFKRCCETIDFDAGLAMQAYLRSGDDDAKTIIEWSKAKNRVVTVRLVKGAYWDYETIHAEQMGWPQPVWPTKRETDACFERMTRAFIASTPKPEKPVGWASAHHPNERQPAPDGGLKPTLQGGVKLALGSHNLRSIAVALAELERQNLPESAIELQMLYGMADPLKAAAVERGLRVREYVPVGEMVPGMAYLVRRLLENTSNESWLKAGFLSNATPQELLASPHGPAARHGREGVRPPQATSGTQNAAPVHEGSAPGHEGSADVDDGVAGVHKSLAGVHEGSADVHEGLADVHETSADVRETLADVRADPVKTRRGAAGAGRSGGAGAATETGHDGQKRHGLSAAVRAAGFEPPIFFTEPLRDFSDARQRDAFADAVRAATVPDVEAVTATRHDREGVRSAEPMSGANGEDDTTSPSAIALPDGRASLRDVVARAKAALPSWRDTPAIDRARCLTRAADLMRRRRDELAGIVIKESGKPWREADADVCEAIDFCEYYAREAVALSEPRRLGRFVGEHNEERVEPRGVCAVISPWNFPLAIACGMATASLVCGNPTILKPAEQTPGIARVLCEILWKAGVPRDVLHFLPGAGETVGAALARHPDVAMIAFTGSAAVGRDILRAAVEHPPRGMLMRHVVCETGGKNAVIVDASADLDEAVVGVRDSAFGFAGQKCSACSRAIVVESVYDAFISRLVESTKSLSVGDPLDPSTDVGPVIDDQAAMKIMEYVRKGTDEATLAFPEVAADLGPRVEDQPAPDARTKVRGYHGARVGNKPLIPPHVFRDVPPDASIATDEIFGPVLAVIRASDFDDAMRIALSNDYRLTGGVYTRRPSHLEKARREFRVGNLYLNRGCTGALVARQPFGGFGLSGLGTKAGGRDYLRQFVVPRVVTENTMRRGFAPDLENQGQVAGGDTAGLRAGV